jgi:hypothetical protein
VATARCSIAGSRWGIDLDTWEIALMAVAGALVLVSEAASIAILLETRGTEHDDPPPWGRRHFFASAAAIGNILFLGAILLSGLATVYQSPCRQA